MNSGPTLIAGGVALLLLRLYLGEPEGADWLWYVGGIWGFYSIARITEGIDTINRRLEAIEEHARGASTIGGAHR